MALPDIIRQLAFLKAGGGEEATETKFAKLLSALGQAGTGFADVQNKQAAAEKARLETDKLRRETTPLFSRENISNPSAPVRNPEQTRENLSQLFSQEVSETPDQRITRLGQGIQTERENVPELTVSELDKLQQAQKLSDNDPVLIDSQLSELTGLKQGTPTTRGIVRMYAAKNRAESIGGVKNSRDLRQELINRPEVKDYMTVSTSIRSMESLLNSALSGNAQNQVALDQGLITMYNKLTDPNSVVRESEYARTSENLPVVNRILGAIGKLQAGGAGMTNDDREALVIGAKIIGNERGKTFKGTVDSYSNLANQYKIDPNLITGALPTFTPFSTAKRQPQAQQKTQGKDQYGFSGGEVKNINGKEYKYIGGNRWLPKP